MKADRNRSTRREFLARIAAAGVTSSAAIYDPAAAKVREADQYATERWRAVEITIESDETYNNPLFDVQVNATFQNENGRTLVRPAFWDGERNWKIRFAPPEVGVWRMSISASNKTDASLNGNQGTVVCEPYRGTLDIYKHGFLRTSHGQRYFTHDDGTPFFYLGDIHSVIQHERFTTSNVAGVDSEFRYIVDKRVQQGFTVYQTEVIRQKGSDDEPIYDLREGLTAATLPGFRNIDRKFKYIADKGLVNSSAMLFYRDEPANHPQSYTIQYMRLLARYWSARYGAYPMLWTVAQEMDRNRYENLGIWDSPTNALLHIWMAAAEALAASDAYRHPLTAYMTTALLGVTPSDSSWGHFPFHSWWAVQWAGPLQGGIGTPFLYRNETTKPLILYEQLFEGFWTDAYGVRVAAYFAFQSGMCGYGYGANGVWNDLYSRSDLGSPFEMPERYMSWYDGANLPGATQLSHLKSFYQAVEWWKLQPCDEAYNATEGEAFFDDYWYPGIMSCDENKDTVVIYFYQRNDSTGIIQLRPGHRYKASWFDPRTGHYTEIALFHAPSTPWKIPKKPSNEDWLLLINRLDEDP